MMNTIFLVWYNMSNCDFSDFYTLSNCASDISSGILFPALLGTIFLISMIGMISTGKSFVRSLTFSSFVCSILSLLLVVMNWLNPNYMYLSFFLTAIGLIGVHFLEAPS